MNNSSQHVINILYSMIASIENGSKTPEQANKVFFQNVSKKQLEDCLTDTSLDADDIATCKDMLKYFFNYEVTVN